METNNIMCMPNEVLHQIYSSLPNKDLVAVARTHSRNKSIVSAVWQERHGATMQDTSNQLLGVSKFLKSKFLKETIDLPTIVEIRKMAKHFNINGNKGREASAYFVKKGIATKDQMENIGFMKRRFLCSKTGQKALEQKLITPEQAASLPLLNFYVLLSEEGREALKQKLITPERAQTESALLLPLKIKTALMVRGAMNNVKSSIRSACRFLSCCVKRSV